MLGARLIREARQRSGLTQRDLAERLETNQSAIARWESGAVSPRADTLERILSACGFTADFRLLPREDPDRDQILERLRWTPKERLQYLVDMLAFEERAHAAHRARRR
jgi:transcriptional regulator with XRE-family HTH domain